MASSVSITTSLSSLSPSFSKTSNNTTSGIISSETLVVNTDELSITASLIQSMPDIPESHIITTCPSAINASVLSTDYGQQRTSSLESFETSQHVISTTLIATTAAAEIQSFSNTLRVQPVAVPSAHVSSKGINHTNSSNGATADQTSYIFALVFGIFGGVLVLGIAFMIFKSMYTKSKNRVKKIKRKKDTGA